MILLVILSIFTGHFLAAICAVIFEFAAKRYIYPLAQEIKREGWTKETLPGLLKLEEDRLFGLLIGLILFAILCKIIIENLIFNFGLWSLLMAILYIVMPVLGIIGSKVNKK